MSKDLRSRMRLIAANTKFYSDVADVMLHKLGQDPHFSQRSDGRSREGGGRLFDLSGGIAAAIGQAAVPIPHFLPAAEAVGGRPTRWKERHDHLPRNSRD